jgi:Leucine-rich repeat (LRR) protein
MSSPSRPTASLSPKKWIAILVGIAVLTGTMLWWKGQSRDAARQRLITEFGATVEAESEELGGGWSVVIAHDAVRDLAELAPLLDRAGPVRMLDLSGSANLATLRGLSGIKALETLIAIECPSLATLEGAENLPRLREIAVSDNPVLTDLDALRNLPALEILDASRCPKLIHASTSELPALHSLSLADCGALTLVDVNGSPSLASLMLDNSRSLTGIAGLEKLGSLTDLIVSGSHAVKSLAGLEKLSSLVKLDLRNTPAAASHIAEIGQLSSLEVLVLGGLPELKDLTALSGLDRLTEFQIEACESLADLRGFPASLTGYAGITHCPALEKLDGIEAATGLERLDLTGNSKLASLAPLAGLAQLRELNLAGCRSIADPGIFAQMPQLGIVQLGGSGVPASQLAELRKSHPETIFDFNAP